ncbi:MAG: glycosyltransferase family 2 protein [Saprospiraceae bacterium]
MAQQTPLVSFITVNYNQTELTLELIESIYQYTDVPFEIIVVDNASKACPKSKINRIYPDVRVIVSGVNRGFAGGNNLGVEISKGQFLFFINNDAVITQGSINAILSAFDNPSIGVVSPLICYYPTSAQEVEVDVIQYAGATNVNPFTGRNTILGEKQLDQSQYYQSKPTFYAHGAAMMVKREVLEKAGLMSEFYFLYYEELDWCERIRKAGYTILFAPTAKIYHKESISVGKTNPLKTYYLTRNRILFMAKNRSKLEYLVFTLFLFLLTIPKNSLMYCLKGEWQHLAAFWRAIKWNFISNPAHNAARETGTVLLPKQPILNKSYA